MGKSKAAQRLLEELGEPPSELRDNEVLVSVIKPRGNNLYDVSVPASEVERCPLLSSEDHKSLAILVNMPPKFRNTIFVKRGGHAIISLYEDSEEESKVKGDFCNIVTNQREWAKYPYWPIEFKKQEEEERSRDMMMPSDDDEYEEEEEHDEVDDLIA